MPIFEQIPGPRKGNYTGEFGYGLHTQPWGWEETKLCLNDREFTGERCPGKNRSARSRRGKWVLAGKSSRCRAQALNIISESSHNQLEEGYPQNNDVVYVLSLFPFNKDETETE